MIDVMIQHADKGPSGFWTDDHEGCGNPKIFPEFEEGLKHGKYVHKNHYLCPWNTAVLYGSGNGNISNGCYYSCSIRDARYLSPKMLKTVLMRFKNRLQSDIYDDTAHIEPLLTASEKSYIEKQKVLERKELELQQQKDRENKAIKASALLRKYRDNDAARALLAAYYGDDITVMSQFGCLDFSPAGMADIVGGEKLSYDDYIDIQIKSAGRQRSWFEMCYHNFPDEFVGCVERKSKDRICFRRIYVSGMYSDGIEFFEGKEDHVWMDLQGFEDFEVGDSVSFYAEVYRYIKTGNGKILDFALRKPQNIRQVPSYSLPSDDNLVRQEIHQIICETCYLSEQCSRINCLRNQDELQMLQKQMINAL